MIRITALMDNRPSENKMLVNEHGLSYLLESPQGRFLFDCGGSGHTLDNAHRLGLSLNNLDGVILSHSHYDHAAGYRDLIEAGLGSRVLYTGPGFFEKKFAFDGVRYTDLSAGFDGKFLADHEITQQETSGLKKIADGLYLVSVFPRQYEFETIPKRFVRQTADGFVTDDFGDEQCLVIDREDHLIVLVGCSHPGILNMVSEVHRLLGKPVRAVYGGTHLVEADHDRVEKTLEILHSIGMETCGFSHCSGDSAEEIACGHTEISTCHLAVGDSIFLD